MDKWWIKLSTQIQDHWIWKNHEYAYAWLDLLMLVNRSDNKLLVDNELITIKRGQTLTSMCKLAKRWGWSRNKTYKFILALEKDGMLHKKSTTHYTMLTIVNYGKYQDVRDSDKYSDKDSNKDTNKHSDKYADKTQTNNEKNEKKEKNNNTPYNPPKEEPLYYPNDEALNDAFKDYVSMRKQTKNPMSDRAITLAMNKLKELSNGDNDLAIKILNQSVMWSWKGLYPLKEEEKKEPTGKRDLLKELWES